MSNLFMVMLGGRHVRANTEVHDVVFAIAETLEDTYSQLKNAWFGEQKGLHIDAWMQITSIQSDGKNYQIQFSHAQTQSANEKLWLINLGGYDVREFGELHRYMLIVAENADVAKQRGKAHFATHWQKQHTDRVVDVDDCLGIDCVDGRFIHLIEFENSEYLNVWENTYITI